MNSHTCNNICNDFKSTNASRLDELADVAVVVVVVVVVVDDGTVVDRAVAASSPSNSRNN